MYKIEVLPQGFLLTFSGFIEAEEITRWLEESRELLDSAPPDFGVIVDMRGLDPIPVDTSTILEQGQKLYSKAGMRRSFVAVNDAIIAAQFKNIAKQSGIYKWERYMDATGKPGWLQIAIDWIVKGIDPDL